MNYIPTIGLEIHAELKTRTKIFCDCLNDPEEKHPNVNVCPICLGHPGTLPVINEEAVKAVLKIGMALNGDIPMSSKFDRKNYFYPDLPKGYQISQYDLPLVFNGSLKGVRLTRIHLEEDAGRLVHGANLADQRGQQAQTNAEDESQRKSASSQRESATLVDFNRAGLPLMELVTEPDIKSSDQAVEFAKELQLILRYLGASDADMEKGQMRVEANVSLRPSADQRGQDTQTNADTMEGQLNSALSPRESATLGTKVEVKNINSFRAVHDAIEYEIKRQAEILDGGGKVKQETRGWDDVKKVTVSQRSKEEAHDYRYFPEPDLPPLDLTKFDLGALKREIPELPQAKRLRFENQYNLKPETAEVLIADRGAAAFFEEAVSELQAEDNENLQTEIQLIFNYLTSDLRGLMIQDGLGFDTIKVTPENFADLVELISHNKASSRAAKDILKKMYDTGSDPHEILKSEGLEQVSDEDELTVLAQKIIDANPAAAVDYKNGKMQALQFLVGKAMGELKGRGNPQVLQKVFKDVLG